MTTRMLEVRCCCKPEKLLGYLPANDAIYGAWGGIIRFPVAVEPRPYHMELPIAEYKTVELPIALFDNGDGHRYAAIKAEGIDINELRKIPGFQEAK